MKPVTGLIRKIVLSRSGTEAFARTGNAYQKDFITVGEWTLPDGRKLSVTPERLAKWQANFRLFRDRGISVPLTVDHVQVRDEKTGGIIPKKLTAGMSEAKRGDVVDLFVDGNRGMFKATPDDEDAEKLMGRVQEVSLELTEDVLDGHGNYYDEAITAITLTPMPVIPGQQKWQKVSVAASREGESGTIAYHFAEKTADQAVKPSTETTHMLTTEQLARARKALGLAASVPDAEVGVVMLSRLESMGETINQQNDRITQLSRQASAGADLTIDEDAAEMAATALQTRIETLLNTGKITPTQKTLLSAVVCGASGKRPSICLSRKAAKAVGLENPLGGAILDIFEKFDAAEMDKLLKETSKNQRKVVLSRDNGSHEDAPAYDPNLTKEMIERANGASAASNFVL